MIASFKIRDRGSTPRGMRKRINEHKKKSWYDVGLLFHQEMRDKRFTHSHASAAGYAKRSEKYTKRKLRKHGHTYPLQWSGKTRRAVRAATIKSTSNGAKVAYAGARTFNFRNPKSEVNAAVEFATITQAEANELAAHFDKQLDRLLDNDNQENT